MGSISGTALPLAFALGINGTDSNCGSGVEHATFCRRTWWSLLVLDTLLGLRIGCCPMIGRSHYNQLLPSIIGLEEVELWRPADTSFLGHEQGQHTSTASPVSRSGVLSTFAELAKLCVVGSDLAACLNSPSVRRDEENEMPTIWERLAQWEQSLPRHLQRACDERTRPPHQIQLLLLFHALSWLCARTR
jgi:hypothetical protein